MTYDEVITEIIERTDESFTTEGKDRAREHFRGAIGDLLREGNYNIDDIHGLTVVLNYNFDGTEGGIIVYSDIVDPSTHAHKILEIKDVFVDPESSKELVVEMTTIDNIRSMALYDARVNSAYHVYCYKYGDKLRFVKKSLMTVGLEISIVVIYAPYEYKSGTGTDEYWYDATIMDDFFSYSFLMRGIEKAVEYFKKEISYNVGS